MAEMTVDPRAFVAAMLAKKATWEEIASAFRIDDRPASVQEVKQWYEAK